MGSSTAWFLTDNDDFDGSVLVIDRDLTFESCSTAHTNSCIRQQFSSELNVRISQFTADFIKNIRAYMGGDERIPELSIRNFGYMYLADTKAAEDLLRENQKLQVAAGAATEVLSREEIKERYPFYNLDDIVAGSINTLDEGHWDGSTVFEWWKRQARERGAEYIENEVVAITKNVADTRVESVTLKSGEVISCGQLLNASGPRAVLMANMAGLDLPVEPRKRYSWIFKADQPLDRELPLTVDPTGLHVRENGGGTYEAGGYDHALPDAACDYDDYTMDYGLWERYVWPTLATRIPQFETVKITAEWAGHYAYNTFDHNAIMGPHIEVENFIFLNGFSGHGLQQSPAMGRGTAEWLTYGEYRSLDLTPFNYARIPENRPIIEKAVI